MTYIQKLVLGCLFFATISCVASEDLVDDLVDREAEPKSIITSGGSIYASLNTTTLLFAGIAVAVLGVVAFLVFTFLSSGGDLPFNSKAGQTYYDPTSDTALEYTAGFQNTNTVPEYRRKRSAFEQSKFNRYQMYIL